VLLIAVGCSSARDRAPAAQAAPRDAAVTIVEAPADARPKAPVKESPPVDTTTGASPTWTPGPSVVTDASVDGAALRERQRARLAADQRAVNTLRRDGARGWRPTSAR